MYCLPTYYYGIQSKKHAWLLISVVDFIYTNLEYFFARTQL